MMKINKSKRSNLSKCKRERSLELLIWVLNSRMDPQALNLMTVDPRLSTAAKNKDLILQKPN